MTEWGDSSYTPSLQFMTMVIVLLCIVSWVNIILLYLSVLEYLSFVMLTASKIDTNNMQIISIKIKKSANYLAVSDVVILLKNLLFVGKITIKACHAP